LQRLEAFRDLIRHGNALLGEVVTYCRDAEAAVSQLTVDKLNLDEMRTELEDARTRADAEAAAARTAMAQVDSQRRELNEMRTELVTARGEMEQIQTSQSQSAASLEKSLREARDQQTQLEHELQRVRVQAASSRTIDTRLAQVEQMESKLRLTERELIETRRALESERSRRDRAIALIKPKQIAESGA
jgi:DNA repair ATPase RecN